MSQPPPSAATTSQQQQAQAMENAIAAAAVQAGLNPTAVTQGVINAANASAAAASSSSSTAPGSTAGNGGGAGGQQQSTEIAKSIETIMKQQFGDSYKIETIAGILQKNMDHFAKQGKLNPAQIAQVRSLSTGIYVTRNGG